jgi:hypothetical protein
LIALTACRVWLFAEEWRHCSKADAAARALGRNSGLEVVRQAMHRRRVDPASEIDEGPLRQLLASVRARIPPTRDGAEPRL